MNLTNTQYEKLMYHYYERQAVSREEVDKRRREVMEKIPELAELEAKVRHLSLSFVRNTSGSSEADSEALKKLNEELGALKEKRRALLLEHGWDESYLEPIYECPDCHDTGYINGKKCHCFEKRAVDYCYMQSGLNDILQEENFDKFDINLYPDVIDDITAMNIREQMSDIYHEAKVFADDFDNENRNLLLYGDTGVGKTFISHCIAKQLLDSGHSVLYLSANRFFDLLAQRQFDPEMRYEEKNTTISYILDCDLLILDDLGTELNNAFTASQLYHCVESRLIGRRSTIISTNLTYKEINERYTERVFSRIMSNYTGLKLVGNDLRIAKRTGSQAV